MSLIIFEDKVDFLSVGTPSTGFFVGYDLDGYLKQKDIYGVIKIIGLGATSSSSSGSTQSLSDTLTIGNTTGTKDIILSNNTKIKNASGNSKILLDYSTNDDVYIENNTNESYFILGKNNIELVNSTSTATMSMVSGTWSSILMGKTLGVKIKSVNSYSSLDGENINYKLNILSDDFKVNYLNSDSSDKAPIIVSSKNANISSGVKNTVLIGGNGLNATQSNSVYLPNVYIQDGKKIKGTIGGGSISIDGDLTLENDNSILSLYKTGSFNPLTKNGIIIVDSNSSFTTPNLNDSITLVNSINSTISSGLKNTIVLGGKDLNITQSNQVLIGYTISVGNNYKLPFTDGSSEQILKTDGSGNVTWSTLNVNKSLSDVLSIGNDSSVYDIIMGTSTVIKTSNGGGQINLDKSINSVLLSNDNGDKFFSYLEFSNSGGTFSTANYSSAPIVIQSKNYTTSSLQKLSVSDTGVLISGSQSLEVKSNAPQVKISNNGAGFNIISTTSSTSSKYVYNLPTNTGVNKNIMFVSSTFSGVDNSIGYNLNMGEIRDIGGIRLDSFYDGGSITSTFTWDLNNSTNYKVMMVGDTTIDLTNVLNGYYGTIIIKQDGTGNRLLSFGNVNGNSITHYIVNGDESGPTLTGNPNSVDILSFVFDGTDMFWTIGNNYK